MKKHSLVIMGHKTSIVLEPVFWETLCQLATEKGGSTVALVTEIDTQRTPEQSLSSAIRVYIVTELKNRLNTHQNR